MSLFLSGDRGLSWSLGYCFLVLLFGGCNTAPERIEPPGYEDDFGTLIEAEPITPESVSEMSMLHQRAQFDLRFGAAIPVESDFDTDFAIGTKFGLEVFKNLFMGLSFSYSNHELNNDLPAFADTIDATASQHYEEFDRYSILAQFDYDVPLTTTSSDLGAWTFRVGLGGGLLIIDGDVNPVLKPTVEEIVTLYTVVLRPAVELRWKLLEHGHVFAGVSYDWVPEDRIEQKTLGEREKIRADIDFDAVNIGAGFSFEW